MPSAGRKRTTSIFKPIHVSILPVRSLGDQAAVRKAGQFHKQRSPRGLRAGVTCLGAREPHREARSHSAGHSLSRKVPDERGWDWTATRRMTGYLIFFFCYVLEDLADKTLLGEPMS